ncbi:dTDP-4-dehydrorhamnose reductase [Undibacterium sp. Rencai35W]|uniref:dTDP-4-dehydrorhamnose reductase n=1 Tax=Undibacterium sp. Rencai35W TaxID=3413046 RepID=UPI003BF0CB7D
MRILLTGSTGQVGNALLRQLQGLGTIIAPRRDQLDLSQPTLVRQTIRDLQPDLILNPGAYTAVDKAESEPDLANAINAESPAVMAEEAKKLGCILIHYSTDYVFSGNKQDDSGNWVSYKEQDAPHPMNVYGHSKLSGEQAIMQSGCRHLIFRTSWVYSLFGKNFLLTMLRLANERTELKVVNDQWGAPTSADWLAQATSDIVRQIQQTKKPGEWWAEHQGLYHMTPAGKTSWCGFTEEIIAQASKRQLLLKEAPHVHGIPSSDYPTPARRPNNSLLDTAKLTQHFCIQTPTWQAALDSCLTNSALNQ